MARLFYPFDQLRHPPKFFFLGSRIGKQNFFAIKILQYLVYLLAVGKDHILVGSVHFDQQKRQDIVFQIEHNAIMFLYPLHPSPFHKLQCRRYNPRPEYCGYSRSCRLVRSKRSQKEGVDRRPGNELNHDFGDNSQGAFGAYHQLG